jgi:putative lipoic acid-binding regulatory protein
MTNDMTQELLEDTHSFPCRFIFKAIGKTDDDFADRAVATVRSTLKLDFDPPHELRQTTAGRHIAVTIDAWVETSSQVIEVYAALRAVDGLVMML